MRIPNVNIVRQSGGRNLCSEACVAMLANYERGTTLTAKQIEIKEHGMDTPAELLKMADRVGLSLMWRRNSYAGQLKSVIDSGRPAILLVTYGNLPKRVRAIDYDDGHYILCRGYDNDRMYYYDPLQPSEQGITWTELGKAWHVQGYYQVIIYSNRVPEKPEPQPIPPISKWRPNMEEAKVIAQAINKLADSIHRQTRAYEKANKIQITSYKEPGKDQVYLDAEKKQPVTLAQFRQKGLLFQDVVEL